MSCAIQLMNEHGKPISKIAEELDPTYLYQIEIQC